MQELKGCQEEVEKLRMREKQTGTDMAELQERESQLQRKLTSAQAKLDLLETERKELCEEVLS